MSEKFYTILTNIGKASVTNATTLGGKVDFKYMALGDGNGSYYNPSETQTALKKEVYRSQINHIQVDEKNPNWIKLSIVVPANIGGFTVREVGAFDTEGNLLLIGKYPETYKPVLEDGSSKDLTINMILEVSNASIVNLKVDPSVIIATNKYVDDRFNNLAGVGRTTETVKKNADDIKSVKDGSLSYADLETVDKTLKGAINELKAKDDSLDIRVTKNTEDITGLSTQMADNTKILNYAVATGTNTYVTTISDITSLVEGMSIKVKFKNANTGVSTLNINSLGAKAIKKGNGNDLSSGNIKAGQILHLVYSGTSFQLLGEGGEYGTATTKEVLAGYTLGTESGIVNGIATITSLGGKKWASGTFVKEELYKPEYGQNNVLTITGLSFTPTTFIVKPISVSSGNGYMAFEGGYALGKQLGTPIPFSGVHLIGDNVNTRPMTNGFQFEVFNSTSYYVLYNVRFDWIAFE